MFKVKVALVSIKMVYYLAEVISLLAKCLWKKYKRGLNLYRNDDDVQVKAILHILPYYLKLNNLKTWEK